MMKVTIIFQFYIQIFFYFYKVSWSIGIHYVDKIHSPLLKWPLATNHWPSLSPSFNSYSIANADNVAFSGYIINNLPLFDCQLFFVYKKINKKPKNEYKPKQLHNLTTFYFYSIMNNFSQKSIQAYDTQVKAKAKRKKVDK